MKTNASINEELRHFGFSEKEVDIYLALLELRSAPASEIAKKARVKRPTAYVVLDALSERGLVNIAERRGVKFYNASSLDQLIQHFKDEAKKYANLANKAKKILPKLRSKKIEDGLESKVQFFKGSSGIKTVYDDVLASLESIRTQAIAGEKLKVSPLTRKEFGTVPEIAIHGNKIILVSPKENFAAVVESKELVDTLKKALAVSQKELRGSRGDIVLKPKGIAESSM